MALKSAFLSGILAHIPEADRGKAEAELAELEAGSLKQADYSRLSNEATAAKQKFDDLYTKNTEWFAEKQAALVERDQLALKVTELEKRPTHGTVAEIPADVIRKGDLDKRFQEMEQGAVSVIALIPQLTLRHFTQFNEVLDTSKLLADPRVQQIGILGVYNDLYKDQIKAKADAAQAAHDEQLRQEGATRARAEWAGSRHPYPVVGNEPSALDEIEAARAGKAPVPRTADEMAHEYLRLSEKRVSAA